MRAKLTIASVLLALLCAGPASAQLSADYATGIRLTASDTNVLATWSDGANVFSAVLDRRGAVVARPRAFDTGARDGFVVRGPAAAWNARTKRFVTAYSGPDGIRVRFLRKNGRPTGGSRLIVPLQPSTTLEALDLAADPVEGTTVLSVHSFWEQTSGVVQIPIDRRGRAGERWPAAAMAVAGRREGGWLTLAGEAGDVFLQRLSPKGRNVGPRRRLTRTPAIEGGPVLKVHPRTGQAMGIWTGWGAIVAQPLTAAGRPAATPYPIKGPRGMFSSLAAVGRDGWMVAYAQEIVGVNEIVVRRLDRRGRPVAEPVIVNPGNVDPWASAPSLAAVGGSALVGYTHQRDAGSQKVVALAVRPAG